MAHSHDRYDGHGDVAVVERDSGLGAGVLLALGLLLTLAIIGVALLWTQPWDDNGNGVDTSPGIDNPLQGGDPGNNGGGTNNGSDGGDGGGAQPPAGQ